MKSEELMVNDLVLWNDKVARVETIWLKSHAVKLIVGENEVFRDAFLTDVEPILLTPEILEANGFKKIPNYDVWLFKQKDIEIRVPLDSFRTFICCKYHTVRCKIAYVHELQHALRLCKINKEIEL